MRKFTRFTQKIFGNASFGPNATFEDGCNFILVDSANAPGPNENFSLQIP